MPVLSRARKVHKAQLAEMASKVLWGSLDQPAQWVLPEKMEIRYGGLEVCVARQAVGGRVSNSSVYDKEGSAGRAVLCSLNLAEV